MPVMEDISRQFRHDTRVVPFWEANDACRNFDGEGVTFNFCDERDAMLICAYIEPGCWLKVIFP